MSSSKELPNCVFDDLLFRRRLERTLNTELERFNALLKEQIALIQKRSESLLAFSLTTTEKLNHEQEADGCEADSATNVVVPGNEHAEL